jgi:hypothetical protein
MTGRTFSRRGLLRASAAAPLVGLSALVDAAPAGPGAAVSAVSPELAKLLGEWWSHADAMVGADDDAIVLSPLSPDFTGPVAAARAV